MNKNTKNELTDYFEKKKQLFRKGVSALIVSDDKEILLVNLQAFETKFYTIPGGGIEEGETFKDAVYREINEELGISKESLDFTGLCKESLRLVFKTKKLTRDEIEYDGMERHFFGFKFIGNDNKIKLQEEEIRSYKWVPCEDLKEYLLFDSQLEDTTKKIKEIFPNLP
ncbi:MAG TPA: NUDIX hydrolase [Ignavibacteria bacterium]|nr:NUDIX hydrolase [Ignavibacteria bacterium]